MSTPQTEQQVAGDYRLEVTDFGPIAKAKVDLRPLTVFIGPSNTGKSYLAILIYVLHKTLRHCFTTRRRAIASSPQFDREVQEWADRARSSAELPEFPQSLNDELLDRFVYPRGMEKRLLNEIPRCFGLSEPLEVVRHQASTKHARIRLSFPYGSGEPEIQYYVLLWRHSLAEGQIAIDGKESSWLDPYAIAIQERQKSAIRDELFRDHSRDFSPEEIFFTILDPLARALLPPVSRNVYYLPANRSGIMDIDKALVRALIQNAATVSLRPSSNTPMLSGGLADFLEYLVQMPVERPRQHDHAERLERHILRGAIRVERTASDYNEFFYRPEEWKSDLPLMRASSMVSELAPIVLYLRYLVQPGDVLIIEEPESHLHPAMQVVFARELARLAHSDIRVVVTTHSEWLLDQFANLVRLSALPKGERKGIPGADAALRPDQFGAWLFKPKQRPRGSVVEEIRVDPEAGGLLTDYGDVAEQLYNEWAEIGNRITESGR